jgi:hypothetical protein
VHKTCQFKSKINLQSPCLQIVIWGPGDLLNQPYKSPEQLVAPIQSCFPKKTLCSEAPPTVFLDTECKVISSDCMSTNSNANAVFLKFIYCTDQQNGGVTCYAGKLKMFAWGNKDV